MDLEAGLELIAMAVSAGPLLGLFGTVWGVMETFCGLASANAVSLKAMAPGVAGSLIATVCGLAVAIPAQVALSFLLFWLHRLQSSTDRFFEGEFTPALRAGLLTAPNPELHILPEAPPPAVPGEDGSAHHDDPADAPALPDMAAVPD
jgi:hypothetical protein